MFAFVLLSGLTATSRTAHEFIVWRLLTGLGASAVVPLALLGWLFGAMAGGMAFGSTFGVLPEPLIGWRGVFLGVVGLGMVLLFVLRKYTGLIGRVSASSAMTTRDVVKGYTTLLAADRGRSTYACVFLNALFHSGVFTWLGVYFVRRYSLGEIGIGIALLGYGVPGFLLGPLIGRAADRWGRSRLIPSGMVIAAISPAILSMRLSLPAATLVVALLSLGYDMTQPLLAGIVTSLDRKRAGQAMGLNVFLLFTGFGVGSVVLVNRSDSALGRHCACSALCSSYWARRHSESCDMRLIGPKQD